MPRDNRPGFAKETRSFIGEAERLEKRKLHLPHHPVPGAL